MSKVHLPIKTTFGRPKGGRIRQVSLYCMSYNNEIWYKGVLHQDIFDKQTVTSLQTTTNSLRQQTLVNNVSACNFLMLCCPTMMFGILVQYTIIQVFKQQLLQTITHVYYTKTYSTNQQQKVCKQQQTAVGKKNFLFIFVAITPLYYVQ